MEMSESGFQEDLWKNHIVLGPGFGDGYVGRFCVHNSVWCGIVTYPQAELRR